MEMTAKALESPEMKKNLEKEGMIPTGSSPEKFGERSLVDIGGIKRV